MTSRPLVILGIVIIAIAIVAAAGYLLHGQNGAPAADSSSNGSTVVNSSPTGVSPSFYQATSTPAPAAASNGSPSAAVPVASTTIAVPFPASTTVDTSSWVTATDSADGYSIEHPADLTQNSANGSGAFSFPKAAYFRWPLQDDVKVTIAVAPSCAKITETGASGSQAPVSFSLNGYRFARTVGADVGAGQRYLEVAYDTASNGQCYHIDFLDHGANGAGFYVDDASLIATYDAEHAADLSAVLSAFDGMVSSFRLLAPAH